LISTTICEEVVEGERERCKADLLPFLNAHVQLQPEFWKDKVEAMKFIARSMATPLTSHFVEQLFSLMGFGTGGRRVNTKDDTMANYLHVQSGMKLSSKRQGCCRQPCGKISTWEAWVSQLLLLFVLMLLLMVMVQFDIVL
jgi:hypothetical protein